MPKTTTGALTRRDIVIPQGATEGGSWPAITEYAEGDPAGPPPGWPGSWVARMQIRPYAGADSLLATLHSATPADGTLTLGTLTDGTVTVARIVPAIPAVTSAAWTWAGTEAHYDLEITNGARVIRLAEGSAVLSGEVTTVA